MMKKIIRHIWRLIPPSTFKTRIQCVVHSREGFSFAFRQGVFEIRGPQELRMFTYEAPFNLVKYYRWFLKYYTPKLGDIVVDAGAYNGHVSILLSKFVGATGRVISFEPDPSNLALCEGNMKLNNCTNITIIEKGLWTRDEVLEFNSNNSVASSVFYAASDAHKIKINVTGLDIFFKHHNLEACHYIKMNIEGSEIMALKGALEVLKKFKPALCITTDHLVDGKQTTEPVEQILSDHQYKVWTEEEGSAKVTYAV